MKGSRLTSRLALAAFLISVNAPLIARPVQIQEAACVEATASLRGAWESSSGGAQVLFKDNQIILRKSGSLSVATILKREPCGLSVRYQGLRSTWKVALEQGMVQLQADEPLKLRPLPAVPTGLDIDLPMLPAPKPVSPSEVKEVEAALLGRARNDQNALKDPALKAKRGDIMADNLRFLRELTSRLGWIDIPRFGKDSASAAILIAKHGSDLLLMKAALPTVERDVKEHGGSGQMFSVLYDELQITLGYKQRYGTQIGEDTEGRPFILPLEDPSKVDVFRKEIGIFSFKDYLKLASDGLGGMSLRVAGSDE